MNIKNEKIRGWLYAFAFVVFVLVLAFMIVTGQAGDDWQQFFLVLLGLGGTGLATRNTSRK